MVHTGRMRSRAQGVCAVRVPGMGSPLPLLTLLLLLSGPWFELGQCAGLPPAPVCPRKHREGGGSPAFVGKETVASPPASWRGLERRGVPPRGGQLSEVVNGSRRI